jgi:hypothetical protein
MSDRFIGVPLFIWAVFCLALAVLWFWLWPRERATGISGIRHIILRWFHALTWLLLAAAALIAGLDARGNARLAKAVSVFSLVVYLIFMGVFVTSKPGR